MDKYSILKSFYAQESWQQFRVSIIAQRGPVCQKCKKVIGNSSDCILHHIKELTPENVSDYNVSLNPENILIVCHDCHDKEHNRFGYQPEHKVYIVFGAPLSGKTTYVRHHQKNKRPISIKSFMHLPVYRKVHETQRTCTEVQRL